MNQIAATAPKVALLTIHDRDFPYYAHGLLIAPCRTLVLTVGMANELGADTRPSSVSSLQIETSPSCALPSV